MKQNPQHVLRVVLQVEDTPANQIAMKRAYDLLMTLEIPDFRFAILKAEQIEIAKYAWPKPNLTTPNQPPP